MPLSLPIRLRQLRLLARAIPRVTAVWPVGAAAVLATVVVLGANNTPAAMTRLRIGGAMVAACAAFLIDDEAAVTLASAPTTVLRRRLLRVAAGVVAVSTWWAVAAAVSDARIGSGMPPSSAVLESLALAAVGFAVAATVARRYADTDGGVAGAGVAIAVFATTFLPPRWWWPLATTPTSAQGGRRIAFAIMAATVLFLVASADRARRKLSH